MKTKGIHNAIAYYPLAPVAAISAPAQK